jgi:hypothetical protein
VTGVSRTRLAVVVALAAAAALAGALLLAGGADGDDGRLAWKGKPDLIQPGAPNEHIVYGQIRNDSIEDVDLDYEDVRVLDAGGREVESAVRFIAAFAHGLYPWSQRPEDVGDFERRRLGEIATLKPGQAVPITLSWRVPENGAAAKTVDFGEIELALPRGASTPAAARR